LDAGVDLRPVVLEGRHVRLEPLDLERHWPGLLEIGLDPAIWRFTVAKVTDAASLRRFLERGLDEQARGLSLAFAAVDRGSGRVAGTTRFMNVVREHRRVEIGGTWLGTGFQRTALNTEAKYLLLRHAFETWGVMRVEFKTSRTNAKSQAALRRLGIAEEGTFRKWMFQDDGTVRDVVWFAVIDDEWPATRTRLGAMLARHH
jgi:N-acetyltransferase